MLAARLCAGNSSCVRCSQKRRASRNTRVTTYRFNNRYASGFQRSPGGSEPASRGVRCTVLHGFAQATPPSLPCRVRPGRRRMVYLRKPRLTLAEENISSSFMHRKPPMFTRQSFTTHGTTVGVGTSHARSRRMPLFSKPCSCFFDKG